MRSSAENLDTCREMIKSISNETFGGGGGHAYGAQKYMLQGAVWDLGPQGKNRIFKPAEIDSEAI